MYCGKENLRMISKYELHYTGSLAMFMNLKKSDLKFSIVLLAENDNFIFLFNMCVYTCKTATYTLCDYQGVLI